MKREKIELKGEKNEDIYECNENQHLFLLF
jgi:hypothetical protein